MAQTHNICNTVKALYNFTTNPLKAYLCTQFYFLIRFDLMIRKTHISAQKPHGRQLNGKVRGSECAIFLLSFLFRPLHQTMISKKGSSTQAHLVTKLMLIIVQSFTTTQRLHGYKFTMVDKSCSQHCPAAVRCVGCHFLMLYARAHHNQ